MRFTVSAAALLAFASSALAQTADFDAILTPTKDAIVPAGSTFDVTWTSIAKYSGSVTLSLLGGKTNTSLAALGSIGTATNSANKFAWAVDATLGDEPLYGIQITLDSDSTIFQFSNPFHIKGGKGTGASGSATGSVTATYTLSSMHTTSASTYPTTAPAGNYSMSVYPTKSTLTVTNGGSGSSPTGSGSGSQPTSGAGSLIAGPLALLGGVAIAALAL